jgi:hypothetical protein
MREALTDPLLLGKALPGDSWLPHRTLLIAAHGEELTDEERAVFTKFTGREREPLEPVDEFAGIAGRRSGKTRMAATEVAYVGGCCEHEHYLASGERAVIPILASTMLQATRAFNHLRGVMEESATLSRLIDGEPTAETFKLKNRVDIETRPANFRSIRGITSPLAVCDEVAFWMIEGTTNPDKEILEAIRPAFDTTGGRLWIISSPYAKRGELYDMYRRDFGPNGDPLVLVAKGRSRDWNPKLDPRREERAYRRDPARAASEYGGEFRNDVQGYVAREIVEDCVAKGVHERPYQPGRTYVAFVDVSGGSSDAMTLAVAHSEGERCVIDLIRERTPPFSPASVAEDFCAELKRYEINRVSGDRYGAEWTAEQFRKNQIEYLKAEHPKSDLYRDLLPALNSGAVELLDHERLVEQLCLLERRVARGGKDSIDHPPHGHDDVANVVAGVTSLLTDNGPSLEMWARLAA